MATSKFQYPYAQFHRHVQAYVASKGHNVRKNASTRILELVDQFMEAQIALAITQMDNSNAKSLQLTYIPNTQAVMGEVNPLAAKGYPNVRKRRKTTRRTTKRTTKGTTKGGTTKTTTKTNPVTTVKTDTLTGVTLDPNTKNGTTYEETTAETITTRPRRGKTITTAPRRGKIIQRT